MTPELFATSTLLTSIIIYVMLCWVLPFGKHRRCRGTGTRPALITRKLKPCKGCKGSGRVLRYGRRAYNQLARIFRDATRNRMPGGVR